MLQLLSWACIVFTMGMFSTGLMDLKRMRAARSADSVQFLPFLATGLNNLGWLCYGTLKGDGTLVLVNTIGASLQALYIACYLYYSGRHRRRALYSEIACAAAVLAGGWFYFTEVMPPGEPRLERLGLTCSLMTVGMYFSPLVDLVGMVRSGDLERLSLPLTVATFLASTSWVLYGLQLGDCYITLPNAPGIVTSVVRFLLFGIFSSSPARQSAFNKLIRV